MSRSNSNRDAELTQVLEALEIIKAYFQKEQRHYGYDDEPERQINFDDWQKERRRASREKFSYGGEKVIRANDKPAANGYRNDANIKSSSYQPSISAGTKQMNIMYWCQGNVTVNNETSFSVNARTGSNYQLPASLETVFDRRTFSNFYVKLPCSPLEENGILFMDLNNPSSTLETYVQNRIRAYEDECREKEKREEKQKNDEQKRRLEEEQSKAEQERIAARNRKPSMDQIFDKVSSLRQTPTPYYCTFDEKTEKFSYTTFQNAPYIIYCNDKQKSIVLPNQTNAFNTGNLSPAVYRCNEPLIDESMRMIEACEVDSNYVLIKQGFIEE